MNDLGSSCYDPGYSVCWRVLDKAGARKGRVRSWMSCKGGLFYHTKKYFFIQTGIDYWRSTQSWSK
jgi:hypothetical protein